MPIRVIVFDWGDTLMRDFGLPGPMADWPRVEALSGAAGALDVLHKRHRLAVASNAVDSGAVLIRRALDRAGIGHFFEAVFSSREMPAAKPDPAFFRFIIEALNVDAADAVSVGNDYAKDIQPAKSAGLRTILLDPHRRAGYRPGADAVARDWLEVPGLICRVNGGREDEP